MKILKLVCLAFALASQITVYASYAPNITTDNVVEHNIKPQNASGCTKQCKDEVIQVLEKKTQGWSKLDVVVLQKIIACESSYNRFAHASTSKEDSWGISQINLLAHQNVTKEQATDLEFSIDFLIKHYQQGDAPSMWYTCYNKAVS